MVSPCGRGGSPLLTDDAFLVPHMTGCPLLIEFAPGSTLYRQLDIAFVDLLNGLRISLPTDQIVFVDHAHGRVTVGFGGMRFAGLKDERLIFLRVRELFSEEQLSPARSHVMILEPQWVASLLVRGAPVWPERGP